MEIQKPTVLDAARLKIELGSRKGSVIKSAYAAGKSNSLCLELNAGELILQYTVEKQHAFIGAINEISNDFTRTLPGLAGNKIISAEQINYDRIVALDLEKSDRLGRMLRTRLILELMPNKGNAYQIDESGRIRWMLRKKEVKVYQPPAPIRKPTILNLEYHLDAIQGAADTGKLGGIFGLNAPDIRIIESRWRGASSSLAKIIEDHKNVALSEKQAWIVMKSGVPTGYALVKPILENGEEVIEFDSAMEMYPEYYRLVIGHDQVENRREALTRILEKEISTLRNRAAALAVELERARAADKYRIIGDLILNNINKIRKGVDKVNLPRLPQEGSESVEIKLDPSKNAAANANDYFTRFKKAAASIKMVEQRYKLSRIKLEDLEAIKNDPAQNIMSLEAELGKRNLLPKTRMEKRRQVEKRLPYKRYLASNGWEILVGRTGADNDELTFKIARRDDYWFHAWQAAGSHAILRLPHKGAIPDKQTLEEAAALAAHYSKARTSSKAAVAYTLVKYVRKPRNFPPGKVLIEKEKQLMVRPAKIDSFKSDKSD